VVGDLHILQSGSSPNIPNAHDLRAGNVSFDNRFHRGNRQGLCDGSNEATASALDGWLLDRKILPFAGTLR